MFFCIDFSLYFPCCLSLSFFIFIYSPENVCLHLNFIALLCEKCISVCVCVFCYDFVCKARVYRRQHKGYHFIYSLVLCALSLSFSLTEWKSLKRLFTNYHVFIYHTITTYFNPLLALKETRFLFIYCVRIVYFLRRLLLLFLHYTEIKENNTALIKEIWMFVYCLACVYLPQ